MPVYKIVLDHGYLFGNLIGRLMVKLDKPGDGRQVTSLGVLREVSKF